MSEQEELKINPITTNFGYTYEGGLYSDNLLYIIM